MKFATKNTNLKLVVDSELINELKETGVKKYPNEFGGFLIGKYSNDLKTLFITKVLLPRKYKGHPMSFERSTDGLNTILKEIFISSHEYYVGEWHTHPNGSTNYSSTDFDAMKKIAEHENVNIKNPVLLILSVDANKCNNFTFYCYDNDKLTPYE